MWQKLLIPPSHKQQNCGPMVSTYICVTQDLRFNSYLCLISSKGTKPVVKCISFSSGVLTHFNFIFLSYPISYSDLSDLRHPLVPSEQLKYLSHWHQYLYLLYFHLSERWSNLDSEYCHVYCQPAEPVWDHTPYIWNGKVF